jgi:hypothetical protein
MRAKLRHCASLPHGTVWTWTFRAFRSWPSGFVSVFRPNPRESPGASQLHLLLQQLDAVRCQSRRMEFPAVICAPDAIVQ